MNARIRNGSIEPIIARIFTAAGPATGATVNLRVKRLNDGFFFDWSDDTFKAFASVVTIDQVLSEFTNVAGTYRLNIAVRHVEGFNTTTAGTANDDVLVFNFVVALPVNASQPLPIQIQIGEWLEDLFDGQAAIPAAVDVTLSAAHGGGSWQTAVGFAVPGSAMALTPAERTTLAGVIDAVLVVAHGGGSWVGVALNAAQAIQLQEVWTSLGNNIAAPASFDFPLLFIQALANVTPIDIAITVVGTTVTLTRQP